MLKIKCPKCDTESILSICQPDYQGPYRCWKCRALSTITIEKGELKSCEPANEEETQTE